MRSGSSILSVAVLLVFAAGMCLAQGPHAQPGGPHSGKADARLRDALLEKMLGNPELVEEIGLSKEQVAGLKEGTFEMRKDEIRLGADLQLAALQQARLVQDPEASEEDIMEAVEETGRIRTEIAKLHMRRLIMVRETLTPEQQEKVHEMVRRHMRKRMQQRRAPDAQRFQEHLREDRGQRHKPRERGMMPRRGGPEHRDRPPESGHPEEGPPPEPQH